MANIVETQDWVDGVYQIETTDRVLGGVDGTANAQAKALASRTAYLKAAVESAQDDADAALSKFTELAATDVGEGAAMVGFKQAGAGAAARTVLNKLREVVSVKDFGAVGDGVTDDTAAIQATLNAFAGPIFFPPGTYLVTSTLSFGLHGQVLVGEGVDSTVLRLQTGTNTGLQCDGRNYCGIAGLKLRGNGNTAGELLLVKDCAGFTARTVRFEFGFNGINFTSINDVNVEDFVVADCTGTYAVRFAGTITRQSDVLNLVSGQITHASNNSIDGVLWESYAHSLTLLNVRIIRGGRGVFVLDSSGTGTSNALPSFFQACQLEVDFANAEALRFNDLRDAWIDNLYAHGSSTANNIHFQNNCWSVRLSNARSTSAWQHGLYVAGRWTQITNCRFYDNGQQMSNTWDGMVFDSTAQNAMIANCASGWSDAFGTRQRYGINVVSGAFLVRYINNDLNGNLTSAIGGGIDQVYQNGGSFRHTFSNGGGVHFQVGNSVANVVNYIRAEGEAASASPRLIAEGSDTNIDFRLSPKGNGRISIINGNGTQVQFGNDVASVVNRFRIFGAPAGSQPQIVAEGTDTNIDVRLTPKGSGRVRVDTAWVSSADAPINGYIEIKDSGGNIRRIATIA